MDAGIPWPLLAIVAVVGLVALPRRAGLHLQCLAIGMAVVVLLAFAGCAPHEYDAGGDPVQAMARVTQARRTGEEVAIRGTCNSSCALKLAAGRNLCVSPSAEIGVHEVRRVFHSGDYAGGVRDELWTGFFQGMLPACARNLFATRHAFAGGMLTSVSGADILRACPTIRACAVQ